MKFGKYLIILTVCLIASTAFGQFEPPVVTLTAHPVMEWAGGEATVTFDLAGRDCDVYMAVYTKDKGPQIPMQKNGAVVHQDLSLGMDYHTFGGVDTCVVVTAGEPFMIGNNRSIVWDGNDKLGNQVPAGEYTYYLIANDANGDPIPFGDWMGGLGTRGYPSWDPRPDQYADPDSLAIGVVFGSLAGSVSHQKHPVQYFQDSMKLSKPRIWGGFSYFELGQDVQSGMWWSFELPVGVSAYKPVTPDPDNSDIVYFTSWDADVESSFIGKALLNPDGPADMVTGFGEEGKFFYYGSSRCAYNGGCQVGGTVTAGSYDPEDTYSIIYVVDSESGEVINEFDAYDYFVSSAEDVDRGARASEGPGFCVPAWNGSPYVVTVQWCACGRIGFNPLGEEDWLIWSNMNGDYYCDHGYPDCFGYNEDMAWVCNDCAMGKLNVCVTLDKYNFAVYDNHAAGPEAAEILGPDGYGICWLGWLSQVGANNKWWSFVIDNDTAYDGYYGLYTDGAKEDPEATYQKPCWMGFDIATSIITAGVGVDDATPAAYSLSNAPDPFNPATTITYGIAKAGHVTLDVYNVMGQKVATLYDGQRDSGSYSIRWDASEFANGVYFAVMNADGITKTEKMMLVK